MRYFFLVGVPLLTGMAFVTTLLNTAA